MRNSKQKSAVKGKRKVYDLQAEKSNAKEKDRTKSVRSSDVKQNTVRIYRTISFSITKLFITLKTPGTPFAKTLAKLKSPRLAT